MEGVEGERDIEGGPPGRCLNETEQIVDARGSLNLIPKHALRLQTIQGRKEGI